MGIRRPDREGWRCGRGAQRYPCSLSLMLGAAPLTQGIGSRWTRELIQYSSQSGYAKLKPTGLGGKFDNRNPSHKMLMSVLGGMSESERQHVQARVRASMDAQVVNEGRHQGGRAPYGYQVVDADIRIRVRRPRSFGCGCWPSMRHRLRWCGGFSLSTWLAKVIGPLPAGSTATASHVLPRAGRIKTGTACPTVGKAARCARSWRTLATPAMHSSAAGRGTRWCSTLRILRPGMGPVPASQTRSGGPLASARAPGDRLG